MAVISAIPWPLRLLAVGLVTAGLGTSVYFLAQSGDADDERVFVAGTATGSPATETPLATTVTPPAPPTQVATVPQPTAPKPPSTPDTRVPMGLQLGKDGKYFVPDRGDGCTWVEYLRETDPDIGLQVFLGTDCPADFAVTFRPESGVILPLAP